jgi:hypothetical protein
MQHLTVLSAFKNKCTKRSIAKKRHTYSFPPYSHPQGVLALKGNCEIYRSFDKEAQEEPLPLWIYLFGAMANFRDGLPADRTRIQHGPGFALTTHHVSIADQRKKNILQHIILFLLYILIMTYMHW